MGAAWLHGAETIIMDNNKINNIYTAEEEENNEHQSWI